MTTVTRSNTSTIAYFSSLDKATQEEKDFAKNNGYCLRIQRANTAGNKVGGEPKSIILSCVHSGRPTDQPRSRSTTSLSENSPFGLQISKASEAENMWSSVITNPNYNCKAADPQAQRAAIHLFLNTLSNRFCSKSNQPSEPAAVVSVISAATMLGHAL
ncbi:hypothetical protein K3495_g11784 [Podosphaera aphanis]|nr:hypothetical protein K3495_g11784 [Podosphaera aphanis]